MWLSLWNTNVLKLFSPSYNEWGLQLIRQKHHKRIKISPYDLCTTASVLATFLNLERSSLQIVFFFFVVEGKKKVLCNDIRVSKRFFSFFFFMFRWTIPLMLLLILISINARYKHVMGCISYKSLLCGSEAKCKQFKCILIRKCFTTDTFIVKMEPIVSNASWGQI